MKTLIFAKRCIKEILRDPINLFFGFLFPLILLFMINAIQINIPVNLFEINKLAPGITIFGLSFMTLFSATLIAKDRETAFLQRLYSTPLTCFNFIIGYTISILPIVFIQTILCYLFALFLGLDLTINIIFAIIGNCIMAIFYISLGLLFGSLFDIKQVGGICGGLLTNLSAWLSGIWFDLSLIGGTFEKIAYIFPFYHAVELEKALYNGNFDIISKHIVIVGLYCFLTTILAIKIFLNKMKEN